MFSHNGKSLKNIKVTFFPQWEKYLKLKSSIFPTLGSLLKSKTEEGSPGWGAFFFVCGYFSLQKQIPQGIACHFQRTYAGR